MQRNILPIATAATLALAVSACTPPEEAYTPVDELKQQRADAEAAERAMQEQSVEPPPVDPTLPGNPTLPPNLDPNAPPMDPTQVPPQSPEEPPKQTMLPEPLPTS